MTQHWDQTRAPAWRRWGREQWTGVGTVSGRSPVTTEYDDVPLDGKMGKQLTMWLGNSGKTKHLDCGWVGDDR